VKRHKAKLTEEQVLDLLKPIKGNGGFQSLVARIRGKINWHITVKLSDQELDALERYARKYGGGGYQGKILAILGDE